MPDTIQQIKTDLRRLAPTKSKELDRLLRRAYALGKDQGGNHTPAPANALDAAVRRWVAAEYEFRWGVRAYHGQRVMENYLEAEEGMRQALCGAGDCPGAAAKLGHTGAKASKPRPKRRRA